MERIVNSAKSGCPFLKSGGSLNNLATAARQCPFLRRQMATRTAPLKTLQQLESTQFSANAPFSLPPRPRVVLRQPAPVAAPSPPASSARPTFKYNDFIDSEIEKKHSDKSYRYFNNINRLANHFPKAHTDGSFGMSVSCCSFFYLSCCLSFYLSFSLFIFLYYRMN